MVNAFWLDADPETTARWLVDAHVTSSVFECSMVLTTAAQLNGYPESESLYFSHADHPLTRWAADAYGNWSRLYDYTAAAHEEWRHRWKHGPAEFHASWAVVESLDREAVAALEWPSAEPSEPPQVTGDWRAGDVVDAYRYYYANEKRHLFEWSGGRSAPPWLEAYAVHDGTESATGDGSDGTEADAAADPD